MSSKEVREMIKRIERVEGAEVHASGRRHLAVYLNGRRCGTLPRTPSDARALKNFVSQIRKNGFPTNKLFN